MKPHLAHINNTLIRKHLAERASDQESSYKRYRSLSNKAIAQGYSVYQVIEALEEERKRIERDETFKGDPLFEYGVANAKQACINAIKLVIDELKGEN